MAAGHRNVPDNDTLNAAAREWIARMACGDESGMGLLYDGTLGHVYGLALRVTRDEDAAEDVVAETFLQAWQQAGRFDSARGTPLAWLLNMARSRALDYLRRRGSVMTLDDTDGGAQTLDQAMADNDPLSLVMALQRDQRLRAAIAHLSPVAQRLLGLAFFRGLSHGEIAELTGLPLGTVKSHLRRAQDALRTHYRE
jgi:RNA polymerase sigma-70 factor (ECF subfamily)